VENMPLPVGRAVIDYHPHRRQVVGPASATAPECLILALLPHIANRPVPGHRGGINSRGGVIDSALVRG